MAYQQGNSIQIHSDHVTVTIIHRDKPVEALIDPQDLELVQQCTWRLQARNGTNVHVVTNIKVPGKSYYSQVKLTTLLCNPPRHQNIGYSNGDPLDCRRENLVVKTQGDALRRSFQQRGYKGNTLNSQKGQQVQSMKRAFRERNGLGSRGAISSEETPESVSLLK